MEAKAVLCIFLIVGVVLGSTVSAYVPAHIDFSSADEDFFALTSFLNDSKKRSEDALSYSYRANVTIFFSEGIEIDFNGDFRNQSLLLADQLLQKLNFSFTILDAIDDSVQSKQILSDMLLPLREIGVSVSALCQIHSQIIDGFVWLSSYMMSNDSYEDTGLQNFSLIHQHINEMNTLIFYLFDVFPLISEYFSIEYAQQLLDQFLLLINRYEEYLSRLLSFLVIDEPLLVLYASKNSYFISEDIVFSGFFIQPSGVISNHSISLFMDDVWQKSTQTNEFGRFSFLVNTTAMKADQYSFFAQTSFQGFDYVSNIVFVDVVLMPTVLSIQSSKRHIQPNESFMISGRLLTIFNKPVEADILVYSSNVSVNLNTDSQGFFSVMFSNFSRYDSYEIAAFFKGSDMYDSSFSTLTIFVNEPTHLLLYVQKNDSKEDDFVYLFGSLLDSSNDVGIGGKFVGLFVNGVKVSQSITDGQGNYSFVFSTVNSSSDVFVFQTRFSGDRMWRPSSSNSVEVGFVVSFFQENFFIIVGLCLVCIGFVVFFYLFRRHKLKLVEMKKQNKKRYKQKNKKPVLMRNTGSGMIQSQSLSSLSNKNKIVSIYHQLLFFFISHGLDIDDSFTHRDIQRKLKGFHLPSGLVDDITTCFERAHYSLQPIRSQDVQRFSRNVKSLQSLFLEGLQR